MKPKKTKTVPPAKKLVLPTIGLKPEEREMFDRAAAAQRLTLSAWVRTTLWKAANEQLGESVKK